MAAPLGKMPTTLVRRLISPLSRKMGFGECNFGKCALLIHVLAELRLLWPSVIRSSAQPLPPFACSVSRKQLKL